MKRTVYIPDELDEKFEEYLKEHPEETLSSVIQEAIQKKLVRKDVSDLLALSGIVQDVTCSARDRAEDYYAGLEKP